MEPFFADDFSLLLLTLRTFARDTRLGIRKLTAKDREMLALILRFEQPCRDLEFRLSVATLEQLKFEAEGSEGPLRLWRLRHLCDQLHGRLLDELNGRLFLAIPPERAAFWQTRNHLESMVAAKLSPQLLEDLEEAGSCLAVGRATASVFHLMRVMEISVALFAKRHGLTLPDDHDWGRILAAIKPKIEAMPQSTDHERSERKRHSEIFSLLYHVKEAWRHPTMHPKRTYTPDQAREIFGACKSYLSALSGLL